MAADTPGGGHALLPVASARVHAGENRGGVNFPDQAADEAAVQWIDVPLVPDPHHAPFRPAAERPRRTRRTGRDRGEPGDRTRAQGASRSTELEHFSISTETTSGHRLDTATLLRQVAEHLERLDQTSPGVTVREIVYRIDGAWPETPQLTVYYDRRP